MLLYSATIKAFLTRVRHDVREIVNHEMNLSMEKSRVLYLSTYYPLNVVVFEDPSRLGYFAHETYELGLSKKLMYQAHPHILKNVLRHELAHFMAFILHGPAVRHGEEFKNICRSYGWGPEVERAYANVEVENEKIESDLHTQKLLLRLKKLLALSSSDNPHERELATLKANALLLEHNLNLNQAHGESEDETVYVKRVLSAPRKGAKHSAIYSILQTFFVSPVFNHGKGIFYLEVIGDKTSVELAEYVAHFLNSELDSLWLLTKKEYGLKSIAAKNSFFRGVARGYVEKIEEQKKKSAKDSELLIIEKNLSKKLQIVYAKIRHSSSPEVVDHRAATALGIESGKRLSIRPGIQQGSASGSSQIGITFLNA